MNRFGRRYAPAGIERATPVSASSTVSQGSITSAATPTDRTGLTVSFTVGSIPWIVEYLEPVCYGSLAGGVPVTVILDGVTIKSQVAGTLSSTAFASVFWGSVAPCRERITTPGAYTRKGGVLNASATGALTFGAGAPYTAWLRAYPER